MGLHAEITGNDAAGNGMATGLTNMAAGAGLIAVAFLAGVYLLIRWALVRYVYRPFAADQLIDACVGALTAVVDLVEPVLGKLEVTGCGSFNRVHLERRVSSSDCISIGPLSQKARDTRRSRPWKSCNALGG
jgi:hypothetical protein